MESFAEMLRRARRNADLTQQQLANKVSVDDSYISRIERGLTPPPGRDKVVALAEVLGINEKAERTYFLAAAGCATLDDLAVVSKTPLLEQPITVPVQTPSGRASNKRRVGFGSGFSVAPLSRSDVLKDVLRRMEETRKIVEELLREEETQQ